jgi:hypothetical protein
VVSLVQQNLVQLSLLSSYGVSDGDKQLRTFCTAVCSRGSSSSGNSA